MSNLRQLSISFNHLKTLEKELFKPLTSLETLILDHNYLEDINEVFLVLSSLKHLSLVHNSVKWFDIAFFPKTVETINLSKNMIEESQTLDIKQKYVFSTFCVDDTFLCNISYITKSYNLSSYYT